MRVSYPIKNTSKTKQFKSNGALNIRNTEVGLAAFMES